MKLTNGVIPLVPFAAVLPATGQGGPFQAGMDAYRNGRSDQLSPLSAAILSDGEIPRLRRWQSGATPLPQVRTAVKRDEAASLTLYEVAIPDTFLAGVAPTGKQLWDLAINDSDGKEREGALELGTGLLQLRWPIGLASWPTDAPAPNSDAKTR